MREPVESESPTTLEASKRYSLRHRNASQCLPTSQPLLGPPKGRVASACVAIPATRKAYGEKGKGKGTVYNPLDDLLKERKRAEQRGLDDEVVRRADAAVKKRDFLLRETDDFTNEPPTTGSTSNAKEPEEFVMDKEDRRRLFGEEQGQVIGDMLEGDKVVQQREKASEKAFGVILWEASDGQHRLEDLMDTEDESPQLLQTTEVEHPVISLLKSAVERKSTFSLATKTPKPTTFFMQTSRKQIFYWVQGRLPQARPQAFLASSTISQNLVHF